MFSLNRVHIIGYQTQPVEVRQTPSGASVTDLNLVVPYSFRADNGEQLSGKGFHTITLWGPMADVAGQYVRPGAQLSIVGRLQTDSWEDEQSGEKRSKTKIVGLDMIMLDPKDGQLPAPEGAPSLSTCVNRAEVIGNVTKDPELRTTTNGQQVLTLGVATNERWKDRATGETKERSEFHSIVIWGDLAGEVNQAVRKGNRLYASGRVQHRSWETQQGSKRVTTEIIADSVSLLGIQNTAASESVDATATRVATQSAAPKEAAVAADTAGAVPSVEYTSDIKVEDLPF